jgi:hypothetical protein
MVYPRLVPSDSGSKKSVTSVTMAVRWVLVDCQTIALVLSCEVFWNSSCTDFMKPESVFKCHSIKVTRRLSVIMARTRSMFSSVVDVDGFPNRSKSETFVRPFLNMVIHSYTLRRGKALLPCCAESLQWASAPGMPSAHTNRMIPCCSSLVHTKSGAPCYLCHDDTIIFRSSRNYFTIAYGVRASTCTQNKQCSQHNKLQNK